MDELDRQLTDLLQADGRLTWTELGNRVGLSTPAVAERVKRLERQGIIRGYAALVDPNRVGSGTLAFIFVQASGDETLDAWICDFAQREEVQECHATAGRSSHLLKIRCRNLVDLKGLVAQIRSHPGVSTIETVVVLETTKESLRVSLDA